MAKKLRTALCLIAVLALVLTNVCTAEAASDEVVSITYWGLAYNRSSMDGFMNDYIADRIGVRVDVQPFDADQLQVMLAGGNLPDIGKYYVNSSIIPIIETDLILELSDYVDQLPTLTANYPKAIDWARDVICEGNGLYCIPSEIGLYDNNRNSNIGYNFALRWDVYEAIGAPAIDSPETLISVLKQMMDYMPEAEDGTKTWGISCQPEWDGTYMSNAGKLPTILGYSLGISSVMEINNRTQEMGPMIDKDSAYVKGLKFLYDCNQAGVLDPDSLSQTYMNTQAKLASGAMMCVMNGNWIDVYNFASKMDDPENPTGYLTVPADWTYVNWKPSYEVGNGNTSYICVSASTEKLDACLKFIDLMFDEEFNVTMYNGPQGVMWDYDENGMIVPLDAYWQFFNDGSYTLESGEVLESGQFWGAWGLTCDEATEHCDSVRFSESNAVADFSSSNRIWDMWRKTTGYENAVQYLEETDSINWISLAQRLLPNMDEDTRLIATSVGEVIVPYSWKMVYASSEDEFWSLFEEMETQCDALGISVIEDFATDAWATALEKASLYE